MAKFYGAVGYSLNEEIRPGVWEEVIKEINYYGDTVRDHRKLSNPDKVLPDVSTGNSIRILADAFAYDHFFAMRYIYWMGVYWTVTDVEVQRPRLLIRLGGVYNGPTA